MRRMEASIWLETLVSEPRQTSTLQIMRSMILWYHVFNILGLIPDVFYVNLQELW